MCDVVPVNVDRCQGNLLSFKCVGLSSDFIMNFSTVSWDSTAILEVRSRVTSCLGSTELEKCSKMSALAVRLRFCHWLECKLRISITKHVMTCNVWVILVFLALARGHRD